MRTMGTDKPVVLVVDDAKEIRRQVETFFKLENYKVETASTIKGALDLLHKSHEITITLVDFHMQNGADSTPILRYVKNNASHRVFPYVYTGDPSHEVHIRAVLAGAKRFFPKGTPLDLIQLYMNEDYDLVKEYAWDDMTRLLNFRGFRHAVLAALASSRNPREMKVPTVFSMIYMDGNNFKAVNDTYGHDEGDRAIRQIGEVIRKHIRPADYACRLYGDEFVVILADANHEKAVNKALELKHDVVHSNFTSEKGERVDLSIAAGVAEIRSEEIRDDLEGTLEDLLKSAERLMYKDKGSSGR